MPKLLIMYNLKDELNEEDFVKWVHEYKGPFVTGLSAVKSYTLTRVQGAMKSEGGPPGPAETPYNIVPSRLRFDTPLPAGILPDIWDSGLHPPGFFVPAP